MRYRAARMWVNPPVNGRRYIYAYVWKGGADPQIVQEHWDSVEIRLLADGRIEVACGDDAVFYELTGPGAPRASLNQSDRSWYLTAEL